MSGIAGLYRLDGCPATPDEIRGMARTLAHRGPDGAGYWTEGPLAFAHLMLRTTPEARFELLPLANERGDLVITADARLDNREELLAALDIGRHAQIGDAGLILRAYQRWGEDCPARLLGDFAFAIWDGDRRVLFCVRDPFGIKPFYYYRSPHLFAFASEIKALLSLPDVPHRLDEARLADFLVPSHEDAEATLYRDVLRLPPAHAMTLDQGGARRRRYWALDPERELRLGSDAEYAEAYRELLTEAVRCRLRSAGPVGSTLSGGLDSSSIVCTARQIAPDRLHTFSAVYDRAASSDERFWIEAVLRQGGVIGHLCHPESMSPLGRWEGSVRGDDEPIWNAQITLHRALYGAARAQGVRVMLDGEGGDEVSGHGVAYLSELATRGRWLRFLSEARAAGASTNRSLWNLIKYRGIAPLTPNSAWRLWHLLLRRQPQAVPPTPLLHPDFARRIGVEERLARLNVSRPTLPRTARQEQWLDLTSGFNSYVLGHLDRTAALFGVEPRYPFWDRRLVEFCLALPAEQKLRQGWTRSIARRALANLLPGEVLERRTKADLSAAFQDGLLLHDRPVIEKIVEADSGLAGRYLDMTYFRRLYGRYLTQPTGADGFALWMAATIALWLEAAVQSSAVSSPETTSSPHTASAGVT